MSRPISVDQSSAHAFTSAMCVEHVPWQSPVVKRAHLQRHRVRQGDDRAELHPDNRMVQRLLQHVNAIGPAEGKRDQQVPLPSFSIEYLNPEASSDGRSTRPCALTAYPPATASPYRAQTGSAASTKALWSP